MTKLAISKPVPKPKEIVVKEGYFLSRVIKRQLGQLPNMPDYLITLQIDGEMLNEGHSGIICVWEQGRVGNINYYQDRMVIFKTLREAAMVQKLIANGGPINTAVFYRKWNPEVKHYHTVETNMLKTIRLPRRVYDAVKAIEFKGLGARLWEVISGKFKNKQNENTGKADKI